MTSRIGTTATVYADNPDEPITGIVYHVRENGWPCVETPAGRIASGPETLEERRSLLHKER
jgi:hypothetical protein